MEPRFVYITTGSPEEASAVGTALVEARLAACVNIVPGMRSLYWWEGAVQEGAETIVIAKSRADLMDDVVAAVRRVHSDEVPCVVAFPIVQGNPDFLAWIGEETRGSGQG